LLKGKDLNECYYWLNELNAMDINTFLRQLYYDFYYALQPDEPVLLSVSDTVRQMFGWQSSPLVFLMRQTKPLRPKIRYILKGPPAKWLRKFEERFHMILRAVFYNHYHSLTYYLHQLLDTQTATAEEIIDVFCRYYQQPLPPPLSLDDTYQSISYVSILCIYARFHLARFHFMPKKIPAALPAEKKAEYPLPPEIASFHLKRWQADVEMDVIKRLQYDPVLIAMALASVCDINVVANYIKSQLTMEERDQALFNENIAILPSIIDEVLAEQIQQHQESYPDAEAAKKHPLLLPAFGVVWLRAIWIGALPGALPLQPRPLGALSIPFVDGVVGAAPLAEPLADPLLDLVSHKLLHL
jgi:hypothetical protein